MQCTHHGCQWCFTSSYKLKRHLACHLDKKGFVVSLKIKFNKKIYLIRIILMFIVRRTRVQTKVFNSLQSEYSQKSSY